MSDITAQHTSPAPNAGDMQANRLRRLERLEHVLDRQFRLPVVGDVGLDGILGLIPGVGDAGTAVISGYLIYEAHRAGARRRTLGRMAANVAIDFGLGLVPVVGDIADFFHKANTKNIRLLRAELTNSERPLPMSDSKKPEPEGERLGHRSPDNHPVPPDQHDAGATSDHRAAAANISTDEETGAQPMPHPVKQDEPAGADDADKGRGGSVR